MTVYFANSEAIDLETIRSMGINVKVNDNPLGFFGTGLKFAIATLLRTGHKVQLIREGELIDFTLREHLVREKPFQFVYMNEERLGYTSDLGRNWEVWQAYREIHSNCVDEDGVITDRPEEAIGDTIWVIEGEEIGDAFAQRDKLFLSSDPFLKFDGIEVHEGETGHIYYRGVRVYDLPVKSKYTYNFTRHMDLTEDRTLKSLQTAEYLLGCVGLTSDNEEFVKHLVRESTDYWDSNINHTYCWNPSKVALIALREKLRKKASSRYSSYVAGRSKVLDLTEETPFSEDERARVAEALEKLSRIDISISDEELKFVVSLNGPLYEVEDDVIYIVPESFEELERHLLCAWMELRLGYHVAPYEESLVWVVNKLLEKL